MAERMEECVDMDEGKDRVFSVLASLKGLRDEGLVRRVEEMGGVEGLCMQLGTCHQSGLPGHSSVIDKRRHLFGSNHIAAAPAKSFLFYVKEALNDVTLIILTIAAVVSLVLSFVEVSKKKVKDDPTRGLEWIEGLTILLAVVLIVVVTAVNNWTKERQFRGLKDLANSQVMVTAVRSGEVVHMNYRELVVGDVCLVKYGDCVPADGIILQSNDIKVDESSLTGESKAVRKEVSRDPFLLSGCHVLEGSGRMVVTGVGVDTMHGSIIQALASQPTEKKDSQSSEEEDDEDVKSILKKKMDKLSMQIGYFGIFMSVSTLLVLIIRFCIEKFYLEGLSWDGDYIHDFIGFVLIAITILVIAIPEGLPLAVLLSLAIAVKRMMKDRNLVRHLDACETMGNATTICSDKTGTLTCNKMSVATCHIATSLYSRQNHFSNLPDPLKLSLSLSIAVNTSYSAEVLSTKPEPKMIGNSTDCSLLLFLLQLGIDYAAVRKKHPEQSFVKVYTFNSLRKFMATAIVVESDYREDQGEVGGFDGERINKHDQDIKTEMVRLLVKGASEIILSRCSRLTSESGEVIELDSEMRSWLEGQVIGAQASQGKRTICMAYRDFHGEMIGKVNWEDEGAVVSDLTYVCIVAIEDALRPEVSKAISQCQDAGITVRMVTGDNVKTAVSIALQCGILERGEELDGAVVMEGKVFNERISKVDKATGVTLIDQNLMDQVWPRLKVLARSTPMDKYNLVKGVMASRVGGKGEVVAVTGDGTNDGPALRKAHVGFAMGIAGTEVAKEASDIILLDDDFTSIVKAVVWGRHVYDSIAKFLQFQLTVNVVAVFIAFISACTVADTPIKAVQMIWINLIQDTLASLCLATEYPSESLLKRRPYSRNKSVLSFGLLANISIHSLYQLVVLLCVLFRGDDWLGIKSGEDEDVRGVPNQHFTFIFNLLVLMSLFNELNCRHLHGTLNFLQDIHKSYVFLVLWPLTLLLQVVIVEFGGYAFFTTPLSLEQWLWCFFFAVSELLLGLIVKGVSFELKRFSGKFRNIGLSGIFKMGKEQSGVNYTSVQKWHSQNSFDSLSVRF